jgi:hypothetical protein
MHTIFLVGKPERKRQLRSRRCRWEDNIRIDLKEVGWDGVNWVHLFRDWVRGWDVVNTVMNLGVK